MIQNSREHFNKVGEEGLRGRSGVSAYRDYAEYILQVTAPPEGARALDLGCGDGRVVRAIADLRPDLHLVGWDLADEKIAQARGESAKHKNIEFEVVDLKGTLPGEAKFDIAYSFSVIQYFTVAEYVRLNTELVSKRMDSKGRIHHLSIPDLSKRYVLFHADWLDRGSPTNMSTYVHLIKMLIVDIKRRVVGDRRYGDSLFHDPEELKAQKIPGMSSATSRPSDSWYRFDVCLRKQSIASRKC
jgi:cyclopropane fatty-acyl-phospholipid synthase-like methyltransferase